jgi:hypothetical protein
MRCRVDDDPETDRVFSGVGHLLVIFTRLQVTKIKSSRLIDYHLSRQFAVPDDVTLVFG